MPFSDPAFEARRAQLLKGGKVSNSSGASTNVNSISSSGKFLDQSFEQRRTQLLQTFSNPPKAVSTPKPKAAPVAKPAAPTFLQQSQKVGGDLLKKSTDTAKGLIEDVRGFFTPQGGAPQPIKLPKIPVTIKLDPKQEKAVGRLKTGQVIPDFKPAGIAGQSAKMGPVKKGQENKTNIIDNIFIEPGRYALDNTGIVGETIKKSVKEAYEKPFEHLNPAFKTIMKDPRIAAKIKQNPVYKFETSALQGVVQGALRVYANISPTVESFLDKELAKPAKGGDATVAGNTVGNVVGTIGAFILGGEVAAALKFGRVALPATFAALGQTSLPSSTPGEARARNLIIDAVAGTLLEYIKPIKNLEHLSFAKQGVEYTKQLTKSLATLSGQIYLDARSLGAKHEEALNYVKDSALLIVALHGFMIAGKAGDYAVKSKFKAGSAEFTPEQARAAVVGSNLENTELGKAIIKTSFDAETQGKNMRIDLTAAKESKVAGVVKKFTGLETPNGIKVTNIELVNPVSKIGATEQPPTAPGTPETAKPVETPITTKPAAPGPTKPSSVTIPGDVKPGEKPFFEHLQKNEQSLIDQYKTNFGSLINTDIAKTLFNDAGYNDINTADAQRAAGKLTEKLYDDAIDTQKGVGNNTVVGTIGETGSGKSSATGELLGASKDQYPIINDSTGSSPDHLNRQIQQALDNGYKFKLVYVYRDPVEAWDNGVLNRKRHVPIETHISTHEKAQQNFIAALEKYNDNPNFSAEAFINANDKDPQDLTLEELKKIVYNKDEIRKGIDESTKRHTEGKTKKYLTEERLRAIQGPKGSAENKGGSPKSEQKSSGDDLTLQPTKADTPEKVAGEAKELDLGATIKFGKDGAKFQRPKIGKTELKTILANSEEFKKNPVLTVRKTKVLDGEKTELVFDGEKISFSLDTEGMQLSAENLKEGQKIKLDAESLTGTQQQMRVKGPGGENLGFNPTHLESPFSDAATEELGKITKQSDIAKALSDKLGVPIRRGKFRHGGAIGIYKPGQKVVRIKSGGLDTIFHEVGHFLDDMIGFSDDLTVGERKSLMSEYAYDYSNEPKKQKKEAFAEYLRYKMTGQDEKIAQWGPEFDKKFQEKIKSMPQVEAVLDNARQDYKRWAEQPATSKILSHISIGKQKGPGVKERLVNTVHDLYTTSLDDLHPLSEFANLAKKKLKNVSAEEDPYILARNLRGWTGKAELFLNKGTFGKTFWTTDDKGRAKMAFKGKSYSEILQPVESTGRLDDFRVYIVAQRIVNDLAERQITSGIALKDAKQALVELDEKHRDFSDIAAERRKYKDELMEFARDNGLIGDEGLAKMKQLNKYHVPFYRVMEETKVRFMGKSKFGGNLSNPIKKIKGSEREIIDPLESDVKDTYVIINASERNNVGVAMANIAGRHSDLGRLFEEVARPMKAVNVNVEEVLDKALKGSDVSVDDLPDELTEIMVTLFRPTFASGPNMLNVNMGDKQKVFEVDSDIFNAIQGLNQEDLALVVRLLSIPAKALRAGATLSPDFTVRNPLRDQFTAFAYSKHGFIPGVDLIRGMFELMKKDNTYDLWKAGGGEHAMMISMDRKKLQQGFKDLFKGKVGKTTHHIKHPVDLLRIVSELGEAGTRLGEMRNALARGKTPTEAAFASRNITLDFARIGAKTRSVNAISAFFNANLQGTDTMIRNFKNRPFQTLLKVLLGITLPSVLLYFANRKDPRYKEIPAWQKDLFWIVLTPNHIWRIPKPFELGVLFGSVPERTLEVMDGKDPAIFNELEKSIADGFTPGFIPTALIPVLENISNYSFFLDRPIVPRGKENLPPGQQSGTYTSEIAKIIGGALNYPPAKVDNLITGYSGGLGRYATQSLDGILKGTGIVIAPPDPAKTIEELPVLKAFMIKDPSGSGSESVNRVYEIYKTTNAELTYAKELVKEGKKDEAVNYVKAHPDSVKAIMLSQTIETFSTFNKAVDLIRKSDMDPAEKRKKIDKIGILQTNLAAKTLEEIKTLDKKKK